VLPNTDLVIIDSLTAKGEIFYFHLGRDDDVIVQSLNAQSKRFFVIKVRVTKEVEKQEDARGI